MMTTKKRKNQDELSENPTKKTKGELGKKQRVYKEISSCLDSYLDERNLIQLITDYACSYDFVLGKIQHAQMLETLEPLWIDQCVNGTFTLPHVRYRTPIEEKAHATEAGEWPESDTTCTFESGIWIRTRQKYSKDEYFFGISDQECCNEIYCLCRYNNDQHHTDQDLVFNDTKKLQELCLGKTLTHFDWLLDQNEIGWYHGKIQWVETNPLTQIETEHTIIIKLSCDESDYDPHHVFVCLKNTTAHFEGERQFNR
jgi:hypothetical protein